MRTYIDFMIDEANEAHNVDLRNLPATAPLFAYLHAASLGAVECKYKHVALELAKLAAAYYLQTASQSSLRTGGTLDALSPMNRSKSWKRSTATRSSIRGATGREVRRTSTS